MNHKILIILTVLLYEFVQCTEIVDNSYCEGTGWVPYKDEKCFKLISKWAIREEAKLLCRDELRQSDAFAPVLVQIKSAEEQHFLTELIFQTSKVQNNVWIGAKRQSTNTSKFEWDDGSLMDYANWAADSPTGNSGRACVEMQSDVSRKSNTQRNNDGRWRDIACGVMNYVVCEKLPRWSLGKLQQTLLGARKDIDENKIDLTHTRGQLVKTQVKLTEAETQLASVQAQLSTTQSELGSLKNNPVPVGFVYVQLANQPEPQTIWPTVGWSDVTSQYAGLFFRAEGGNSAAFGSIQNDESPRLIKVENKFADQSQSDMASPDLIPGQWSTWLRSGAGGNILHAMRFLVSDPEVRPRNQAMRIWKRIN